MVALLTACGGNDTTSNTAETTQEAQQLDTALTEADALAEVEVEELGQVLDAVGTEADGLDGDE